MKAIVTLARGFEEIEAVTIIDVLRRAGISVTVAALGEGPVEGSHGIEVGADVTLDAVIDEHFDAVVLPGGMPGSRALADDPRVKELCARSARSGALVAAICAAPIALEAAGVLRGKRATAYPGNELPSAHYVEERVVVDGNVITSRGPGTALEFSLALVERLKNREAADELAGKMIVQP